jgi:hypothetical protein
MCSENNRFVCANTAASALSFQAVKAWQVVGVAYMWMRNP